MAEQFRITPATSGVAGVPTRQTFGDADNEVGVTGRRFTDINTYAELPVFGGLPKRVFTGRDVELTLTGIFLPYQWSEAKLTPAGEVAASLSVDPFASLRYYKAHATPVKIVLPAGRNTTGSFLANDDAAYELATAQWLVSHFNTDDSLPYRSVFDRRAWECALVRIA